MKKLAVIGSINIDFVLKVKNFPKSGETINSLDFFKTYGGKGANQAIALGKLDADVTMFGKVGSDSLGKSYIDNFHKNNVKTDYVEIDGDNTGVAIVTVDSSGANNITLATEANFLVDEKYIDRHIDVLSSMDIVLLQLEIPIDTVRYALERLKEINKNIITILDPAPAMRLPTSMFSYVDYITPNETETFTITGVPVDVHGSQANMEKAGATLRSFGAENAIVKAGKYGACIFTNENSIFTPTYDVKPVDTTAAGDSFNAGFAKGLSLDFSQEKSMMLANAVGSLATTGLGAQTSMPSYEQACKLMEEQVNIEPIHI